MFNKKSLSLAVAAAATGLSLNSMAALDVTSTTAPNRVAIASESVTPTTTGLQTVANPGNELDVQGLIGVGLAANDQVFVRLDLTGATFVTDLAATAVSIAGAPSSSLSGGLAGEDSAVFGYLSAAGNFQTDAFTIALPAAGINLAGASADVRVRVYEQQSDAINETGVTLSDQALSSAISVSEALNVSFTNTAATAEVSENFLLFSDNGATTTIATLGSFTATASTSASLATTLAPVVVLGDLVTENTSVVTITGDFSFATDAGSYYVSSTTGTCDASPGAGLLTVDTSTFTTATTTVDVANGLPLCVSVNGTSQTIPDATYSASVNLVHAVTTSSPASTTAAGGVGEIARNGTTVEVAYLTTFGDYNQRLIINSRHPVMAQYNITFQTEDGVTATPTALASGTLAPNENLVLRASDLVTLTGGTRCSATVTVVAPNGNISVATTQVNLSDASTDTVSYN